MRNDWIKSSKDLWWVWTILGTPQEFKFSPFMMQKIDIFRKKLTFLENISPEIVKSKVFLSHTQTRGKTSNRFEVFALDKIGHKVSIW